VDQKPVLVVISPSLLSFKLLPRLSYLILTMSKCQK
jgi:hypothetical protein